MARIDDIIAARRGHRFFDEELWDFVGRRAGRLMENLSDEALRSRLAQIDRNIQYLDDAPGPRDELPPERGWLSPWFWLRLRHYTLVEFAERSLSPSPSADVAPMPPLHPTFRGLHAGGDKRLVRISREPWLMETLNFGRLRLTPATAYREIEGDAARTDNEMAKAYRRPGRILTITGPAGQRLEPIGDVTFSSSRVTSDGQTEIPYWLMCFSTDLDPRLVSDFPSAEGDDAVLVIFDPMTFIRRGLDHLNHVAPRSVKSLCQVNYYDGYHPPSEPISAVFMKDIRFAYQREWRMVLDPEGNEILANGGVLTVDIGSIADIAAIYSVDGGKIAGAGPETFLAL